MFEVKMKNWLQKFKICPHRNIFYQCHSFILLKEVIFITRVLINLTFSLKNLSFISKRGYYLN